jgi:adenosyl cobinamide kinase/adenosyl cobinamide phosphate guanylyltransferase
MKTSASFSTTQSQAILVVGEPKSGKSNLALAFPDPAIIDWDLNLASAVRRATGKTFDYTQPGVRDDGSQRPLPEQWKFAVEETKAILANPKYKTVIIDGLGLMCTAVCEHIIAEGQRAGTNKLGKMEIQNYADLSRILRSYIMMIRASGKFFVVTSHQTGDKDDVTGVIRYVLAIPGQSKDTLGGCFTDVWATMARPKGLSDVAYEIRTKPTGQHVALGASFPVESSIDVTNKTPAQIWDILSAKIGAR